MEDTQEERRHEGRRETDGCGDNHCIAVRIEKTLKERDEENLRAIKEILGINFDFMKEAITEIKLDNKSKNDEIFARLRNAEGEFKVIKEAIGMNQDGGFDKKMRDLINDNGTVKWASGARGNVNRIFVAVIIAGIIGLAGLVVSISNHIAQSDHEKADAKVQQGYHKDIMEKP